VNPIPDPLLLRKSGILQPKFKFLKRKLPIGFNRGLNILSYRVSYGKQCLLFSKARISKQEFGY
jgi:hypothetical protein